MANLDSYEPSLTEVINLHIDNALMEVNVCLPGKIVAYDAAKQVADIQPQILSTFVDGSTLELPVIPSVPVVFPRANGGTTYMHIPLAVGDDVTLIFSQSSLDNWKTQGGLQEPGDVRKHHLTDAFALVGGSAIPNAFVVNDPQSIEIKCNTGAVQIKPDGTINIGSFSPPKSVGLGEAIESRLSTLENGLTSLVTAMQSFITTIYDTHTHPANVPPVTTPPAPLGTAPSSFSPDTSVVSSTKAKVVT
jgi:hypothetical protein